MKNRSFTKRVSKLILFLMLNISFAYAQQQVMYTQYMFNGLAINPAYAGSHETLSLTALAREQWIGIDGAPSTQTFSAHAPIKSKRIGVGLLFLNDEVGVTSQTGAYGSYSYKINFNDNSTLSMGISGGFTYFDAAFSEVSSVDPSFQSGDIKEFQPNVGLGLYYYTDRFFAGISTPQVLETTFDKNNEDSDSKLLRHYFASVGYVMDINHFLKLKPHLLVKYVEGAPVEFDVNASVLFQEVVWLGVSWRSFDSIDAILQLQVSNKIQIGYAYDFYTTTDLSRVNVGSHELMLNYRFDFSKNKVVTPRYF
ncbi:membrane protein [Marivirga tractuosa]|uniref:Membrane protein n=1 Tax=Marivirga tractuosa (strain ATCC 23168 / DSM 4126 / NBRC 15989 / NCIMB 1408 / VKM B-1430 / H-43) TaxID=643867 RepID=E4TKR3_MARTH|nr:type IX secretion system membrane protein PorP/SprF [Marivirga tractuosa]ADR21229.1 putative membrane protein [Marivirga tractuosa DSM 4126]BDD14317.1 membrane protein [Marivirga tractuosa]